MNPLQKAVTTIQNWLVLGPNPKVRDPQNSARRVSGSAGVAVNDQAALGISAFFACLRLVASTIGSLPFPVYQLGKDGVPEKAVGTSLWKVLQDSPNADQTPVDFWEFVVVSMLMRGNAYARILNGGGKLIGLELVRPDIMSVRRGENGRLRYRWTFDGKSHDLDEDEVFHVRGFGGGPLGGLSVVQYAAESLGIAIAADRSAASMFGNGVSLSGALSFKEFLKSEQREIAYGDLCDQFVGAHNAGKPMILEGGATWTQISMKADEAQLLESRGWSVEEICRWFGVPPFMIGHNEKTTSWGTGIEQMLLGFQKFTLNPYLRRIEQAVRKQLLTPAERARGMFAEFNVEGLLRGDSLGRARFYQAMVGAGIMTRNEARQKENLPPVEGGDVITVQSQNISLEDAVQDAVEEGRKGAFGGSPYPSNRGERGTKRSLKVRDFPLCVKADGVDDAGVFEGYGSVFGVVDSYQEVVAEGAFAESLAELAGKGRKVPVLWQHRTDQPIGIYLDLKEDETGLFVKGQLLIDAVAQAAEAHALMKMGAVTGLSIGYWVRESSYDEKTGIRTLTKLDLVEVSLVTMPANDDARVEAVKFKLAHGQLPEIKELEKVLREAGFSKTQAAVVAGHGLPELLRREAEGDATPGADFLSRLNAELRG